MSNIPRRRVHTPSTYEVRRCLEGGVYDIRRVGSAGGQASRSGLIVHSSYTPSLA